MLNRDTRLERYLLISIFFFIVIRNAWVSDDAYITFRTIENFLSGYGLTYNPYVRVQAFTHPMWMFLLSGIYYVERLAFPYSVNGLYLIAVFVSIAISVLLLYLSVDKIINKDLITTIFIVAVLTLSRAFIDYSTSGLENPLTHLLLVLFVWIYLTNPEKILHLALVSSLLVLTRQDAILLILPALLYLFWARGNYLSSLKAFLPGLIPLVAWELFSIFYYGFPFPNTAYAKLNTGIESSLLIQQGMDYLLNSIHWDPATLFVIVIAGIVMYYGSATEENGKLRALYLGTLIYVLYVVKIGGDFMSGRFLTAPLLLSVLILARSSLSRNTLLVVIGIVSLLGAFSLRSTLLDPRAPATFAYAFIWDGNDIADERSVYFANEPKDVYLGFVEKGFRNSDVGSNFAGEKWYFTRTRKVLAEAAIGRLGYTRGPNIYIVDNYALVDPLLARLPTHQKQWRIGHFGRDLPPGYLETLEMGTNQIADPNLALYYKELSSVIQGPLWDWERMVKIWKFNTGQYDYLLRTYIISAGIE
jgi:arabinofuranosyltransferase